MFRNLMRLIAVAILAAVVAGCGQPIVIQPAPPPAPPPGPPPGPPPNPVKHTFNFPKVANRSVDWCQTWATNCGWGGAHNLCKYHGYVKATSWSTYKPGSTFVIGSNQVCNGPNCTGFKQVVCSN